MSFNLHDLSLFAQLFVRVLLLTGLGPAIAIAICLETFSGCPVVQSRLAASLADWRMRARNGRTSQETVGNRASSPRTAQRRVNDLTNTGAPWTGVEASQSSGCRQLANARGRMPTSSCRATSLHRKVRRVA
jgi:hypothetical protein